MPAARWPLFATRRLTFAIGTSLCHAEQLGGVVDDCVLLGEAELLELLGVRGGDLSASDAGRGRLEVVEGVLAGEGHDLGGDAVAGEARLDAQHVAGLLDALDDGLNVQRLDAAQVDHLGLDAVLLLQLLGGNERLADAAREGDDGEVLAGALDLGLAELMKLLACRNEAWLGKGAAYGNDKVILLGLLAHGEGETVQKPGSVVRAISETCLWRPHTRSREQRRGWGRG